MLSVPKEIQDRAGFKVGDDVYVNGVEPGTVVGRFYRTKTRSFVYDIGGGRWPTIIVRVPEERLSKVLTRAMGDQLE